MWAALAIYIGLMVPVAVVAYACAWWRYQGQIDSLEGLIRLQDAKMRSREAAAMETSISIAKELAKFELTANGGVRVRTDA